LKYRKIILTQIPPLESKNITAQIAWNVAKDSCLFVHTTIYRRNACNNTTKLHEKIQPQNYKTMFPQN